MNKAMTPSEVVCSFVQMVYFHLVRPAFHSTPHRYSLHQRVISNTSRLAAASVSSSKPSVIYHAEGVYIAECIIQAAMPRYISELLLLMYIHPLSLGSFNARTPFVTK
jgi:hypothetical protein